MRDESNRERYLGYENVLTGGKKTIHHPKNNTSIYYIRFGTRSFAGRSNINRYIQYIYIYRIDVIVQQGLYFGQATLCCYRNVADFALG